MNRKFECAYLHFGSDKTGSTAIQASLHASRALILGTGAIAYPPGRWHPQLGSAFSENPEKYVFNKLSGLTDPDHIRQIDRQYIDELTAWLDACKPCRALVFSYEGFPDLDAKAMAGMRAICLKYAHAVKVVMYIRPPLSYAVSVMSQRVKQGFPSWPANNPPISPHKDFLERIASAFPKDEMLVRLFSRKTLRNGDVLADFLHVVGLDDDLAGKLVTQNTQENESLSDNALRVGDLLIESLARKGADISPSDFHQQYGQYLVGIPGNKILLSQQQANQVLEISRIHSEFALESFGVSLEDEPRASPDIPGDDEAGLVPVEALASFLSQIVAHGRTRPPDLISPHIRIERVQVIGKKTVCFSGNVMISIEFSFDNPIDQLQVDMEIVDQSGRCCYAGLLESGLPDATDLRGGRYLLTCSLVAGIPDGHYKVCLSFSALIDGLRQCIARLRTASSFDVATPRSPHERGYSHVPIRSVFQNVDSSGDVELAIGAITSAKPIISAHPGEEILIPIIIANNSRAPWASAPAKPLNVIWDWRPTNDQQAPLLRETMEVAGVGAGQELGETARLNAPDTAGTYTLTASLSQPGGLIVTSATFDSLSVPVVVCPGQELHIFAGSDSRLLTKVGRRNGIVMESTGAEGFLLFGPYLSLPAGDYLARISFSSSGNWEGTWADVCSTRGARPHVRQTFSAHHVENGFLWLAFSLQSATDNIETRVWVPSNSDIRVDEIIITRRGP